MFNTAHLQHQRIEGQRTYFLKQSLIYAAGKEDRDFPTPYLIQVILFLVIKKKIQQII